MRTTPLPSKEMMDYAEKNWNEKPSINKKQMKVQKKYFLLRVITFPIKLVFDLLWFNLFAIVKTFQWVVYGGDEIIFGKDFNRNQMSDLIDAVENLKQNNQ